MGSEDRSLVARVRALQEDRQRDNPLIVAMSKSVKDIRTEICGMNQTGSLALGNSRYAVEKSDMAFEDVMELREVVLVQADTITGLQNDVIDLRAALKTALDRIEADSKRLGEFVAWAKSKGKT